MAVINRELVYARIDMINKSLVRLDKLVALGREGFAAEADNYAIAEHHLRRILESVFDIGRHIIAKAGLGHPDDYREIIITLSRAKIIPPEFAERIKGMAGYRNCLVHGYAEVTAEEIYQIIREKSADIREFCRHILEYMR
ncbi:MAG: type VII toxin-antitoxin system HepT family RNase toxin [Desulfurispora sp.]|uniref:type VII toxin-antitoxin system HepT family RNase toxin n=1 Tax=Desulfurispora sp. TaxID=3014275 RepID=UPI00404B52CD